MGDFVPKSDYPNPFAQGFIEAMFAQLATRAEPICRCTPSDLAPEALALILEDCAYAEGWLSQGNMFARGLVADAGRVFFKDRQHGRYQQGGLPETLQKMEPLAPYLRADGKVDLRNT